MKKTIMIAGLIVASVMALAGFASLAIAMDNKYTPLSTIQVSDNGNTWQVNIGELSDITNINAVYWYIDGSGNPQDYPIVAKNVVLNANKIQLVFDTSALLLIPTSATNGTRVSFDAGVVPYVVSGPGFAWARR